MQFRDLALVGTCLSLLGSGRGIFAYRSSAKPYVRAMSSVWHLITLHYLGGIKNKKFFS